MGTDSNEMFHISTARSALPIINISHDAGLNLSAEFSRRIILNKSFSQKLIKRILGLNKHIGIIGRLILFLGRMKLKKKRNNRIKLKLILKNRLT